MTQETWPRPFFTPIPNDGTKTFSLDGEWELLQDVERAFPFAEPTAHFDLVTVPSDLVANGKLLHTDAPFLLRKRCVLPAYAPGNRVLFYTGTIHEHTQLYVNGKRAGECLFPYLDGRIDITELVAPLMQVEFTLLCENPSDHLSGWVRPSGTATEGGLLRSTGILFVTQACLTRFCCNGSLQAQTRDGLLEIELATQCELQIKCRLLRQNDVLWETNFALCGEKKAVFPIAAPAPWEPEHPQLYTLQITTTAPDGSSAHYEKHVGFRTVEKRNNELYINGRLTKLRGVARYSHDPLQGKYFTDEQYEREIRLMKEANVNYIRLSVYPERERFAELCDEYGIFLQLCSPVTFQQNHYDSLGFPVYTTSCDKPMYRARFLDRLSQMIEIYRSHASVILWEYANESDWGCNLAESVDYIRLVDPTRLVTGTWGNEYADVFAYHYPEYKEVYTNCSLYDEYTHITTHAMETLRRDPNARNAWGLSIAKGWDSIYHAQGVVGAAIFAMGDFVRMTESGKIDGANYGQWGVIDKWMREKPEHWLVKKAYSPVKLVSHSYRQENATLMLRFENRSNATNLAAYHLIWHTESSHGELVFPNGDPRDCCSISMPLPIFDARLLSMQIVDASSHIVDTYDITLSEKKAEAYVSPQGTPPKIHETETAFEITTQNAKLCFSKSTGLITQASCHGEALITGGPYLNWKGLYYKTTAWPRDNTGDFKLLFSEWTLQKMQCRLEDGYAVVTVQGSYPGQTATDRIGTRYGFDRVEVQFVITISDTELQIRYTILTPPPYLACEAGVAFLLPADTNSFHWQRNAAFSGYPEHHIGRAAGTAVKHAGHAPEQYRQIPQHPWQLDETDFVLRGAQDTTHGTNDFRTTREHIISAAFQRDGVAASLEILPAGADEQHGLHVRASIACDEDPALHEETAVMINDILYYDLGGGSLPGYLGDRAWGNYLYPEIHLVAPHTGACVIKLHAE